MYNNNFLTDVIFRVDFSQKLNFDENGLDSEIMQICLKNFPMQTKKQNPENQIIINPNNQIETKLINKTEWHFTDVNKEKEITIAEDCYFILYKKYINFSISSGEFLEILKSLLNKYQLKINRLGLRYIDDINMQTVSTNFKDWFNYWKKYINVELIHSLNFNNNYDNLSRCFNSIETNYSDYMLRFQYGIFNTDYPAVNKKPSFILDTDVYSIGLYEFDEIQEKLKLFHAKAKDWFEKSITNTLRNKMGTEENG